MGDSTMRYLSDLLDGNPVAKLGGVIFQHAGLPPPANYLPLYGRTYLKTSYPELYELVGGSVFKTYPFDYEGRTFQLTESTLEYYVSYVWNAIWGSFEAYKANKVTKKFDPLFNLGTSLRWRPENSSSTNRPMVVTPDGYLIVGVLNYSGSDGKLSSKSIRVMNPQGVEPSGSLGLPTTAIQDVSNNRTWFAISKDGDWLYLRFVGSTSSPGFTSFYQRQQGGNFQLKYASPVSGYASFSKTLNNVVYVNTSTECYVYRLDATKVTQLQKLSHPLNIDTFTVDGKRVNSANGSHVINSNGTVNTTPTAVPDNTRVYLLTDKPGTNEEYTNNSYYFEQGRAYRSYGLTSPNMVRIGKDQTIGDLGGLVTIEETNEFALPRLIPEYIGSSSIASVGNIVGYIRAK